MTDTLTSAPPLTDATTADRLSQFLVANPRAHLRDAAVALSVSELSLLLAHQAAVAVPLRGGSWPDLFAAFETLGEVRTMTRNEWAVIERTGSYVGVQSFGLMGQSVGPELDVRAFFREWRTAWAVTTTTEQGPRLSIQLFDASGDSIHKVFATDAGHAAFSAMTSRFRAENSTDVTPSLEPRPTSAERPDDAIDVTELHARWDAMKDSHQFHGMLRDLNVTRTQALRLAGDTRAKRVGGGALQHLLEGAAATAERVMIFVGNRGLIQIHIGEIHRVVRASGWLNVLDPRFNLHVRDTEIASSWIVTKQSTDGPIQSLEVFANDGSTIAQVFGKRMEGTGSTPIGFGALLDGVLDECAE